MVIATFTITEERKKSYNFSDPYFTDGVALMVKKDSGIKSLKDLDGKKIGVAQSATSKGAVQEAADKLGTKVSFLEFGTYPEIKTALDAGRVNCFSVDAAILFGYLDDSTVILPDRFAPQEYGVTTKLSNTGLAKLVNDTVADMKKSGDLDKLIQKWGLK
jgi:putative glutamine transport system substrate-binding protein